MQPPGAVLPPRWWRHILTSSPTSHLFPVSSPLTQILSHHHKGHRASHPAGLRLASHRRCAPPTAPPYLPTSTSASNSCRDSPHHASLQAAGQEHRGRGRGTVVMRGWAAKGDEALWILFSFILVVCQEFEILRWMIKYVLFVFMSVLCSKILSNIYVSLQCTNIVLVDLKNELLLHDARAYLLVKKGEKKPIQDTHSHQCAQIKKDAPLLSHKVGGLVPKLVPIRLQGKEVIDTSCASRTPKNKLLTSEQ